MPPAQPIIAASAGLGSAPFAATLAGVEGAQPVNVTALVGEAGFARLYSTASMTATMTKQVWVGQSVDVAASPSWSSANDSVVSSTNPNLCAFVQFANAPPTISYSPTLPGAVVLAVVPPTGIGELRLFLNGALGPSPVQIVLDSPPFVPKAMRVVEIGLSCCRLQYAWVAGISAGQGQVRLYNLANKTLIQSFDLGSLDPLEITVGMNADNPDDVGSQTAFLHVLVHNPNP